ncbi:MAG: hypothetical protein B7Z66_05435 [Chromatiales bacterium 21-64-14]|nr:MAG: hypothetical protein B7Z66_05435 [Chromatiales bacterium 21-64-14]HQU15067.1 protein phosphatase CheZ [Gammaproteobacteria bacterium]
MASKGTSKNNRLLDTARELVTRLETGDELAVPGLLEDLTRQRGDTLYEELGKLTRQLHESLNSFRTDARLAAIATHEMPDAKDRLNYVISMTEQAAHRTLTAVERRIPVVSELEQLACGFSERWERFQRQELGAEEVRTLTGDLQEFLNRTGREMGHTRSDLTEVLMAQEFQDLSGQIIRRVIGLVHEVESHLVHLIRISGDRHDGHAPAAAYEGGPVIPGREDSSVVSGQDDVDDLLSSLGF